MFAAGETITLLEPGTGTDRYGDESPDWSNPSEVDVTGAIAPRVSSALTADGDKGVVGLPVYLPFATTVPPQRRAGVRGAVYEVVGEPAVWRNPYTGWE